MCDWVGLLHHKADHSWRKASMPATYSGREGEVGVSWWVELSWNKWSTPGSQRKLLMNTPLPKCLCAIPRTKCSPVKLYFIQTWTEYLLETETAYLKHKSSMFSKHWLWRKKQNPFLLPQQLWSFVVCFEIVSGSPGWSQTPYETIIQPWTEFLYSCLLCPSCWDNKHAQASSFTSVFKYLY